VAHKLLGRMGQLLSNEGGASVEQLTERELDVLRLLVKGARNKEIANQLFITERTVKFHTSLIFQKLGVTNRSEAIAAALQRRLVRL
jgi:DNA-binding NarL/FixJ family response regulator